MDQRPRYTLRRTLAFSFLAGIVGAAVALLTDLYFIGTGWFALPTPAEAAVSIGVAFLIFFIVTFRWLVDWYLMERLGGRVAIWQIFPGWLRPRPKLPRKNDAGGDDNPPG